MLQPDSKPTQRQLRYLGQLAELTGTSFRPPATRRQASQQIELAVRPHSARDLAASLGVHVRTARRILKRL